MKITIYELLGLIKEGKAPKKIKWGSNVLCFDTKTSDYLFSEKDEMYTNRFIYGWGCNEKTNDWLNSYVRILDEEDKFIDIEEIEYKPRKVQNAINELIKNQKKIINKLKEEGK